MGFLRRGIVTLVILGVLLAAADVGARMITQRRVAQAIQTAQKLPETPDVGIGGFSFLTQAARGRYDAVTVTTGPVPAAAVGVPLSSVTAQLSGVSLPPNELIAGQISGLPVDAVQAKAAIGYASLTSALKKNLPPEVSDVRLSEAPGGQLRVAGTYSGFGLSLRLTADATLRLSGSTLTVSVPQKNLTQVPEALRPTLAELLTVKVAVPKLPNGLRITGVQPQSDGIAFAVTGRNVTLR